MLPARLKWPVFAGGLPRDSMPRAVPPARPGNVSVSCLLFLRLQRFHVRQRHEHLQPAAGDLRQRQGHATVRHRGQDISRRAERHRRVRARPRPSGRHTGDLRPGREIAAHLESLSHRKPGTSWPNACAAWPAWTARSSATPARKPTRRPSSWRVCTATARQRNPQIDRHGGQLPRPHAGDTDRHRQPQASRPASNRWCRVSCAWPITTSTRCAPSPTTAPTSWPCWSSRSGRRRHTDSRRRLSRRRCADCATTTAG